MAEWTCWRCGQPTGGQGDTTTGFHFDGKWYDLGDIVFFCSETDMTYAMRLRYGREPWIEDAIEAQRRRFMPDRRLRATD